MRTLYLLRHAKSSWDDPHLADFERPLNERGRRTAPFMGELMKRSGFVPELVISSPARRAIETARAVKAAAGFDAAIAEDGRVYEAGPLTLEKVVSETADGISSVLLVGHNPGMEGFIRHLSGRLEPMPTAALAVIELDIEHWRETGPATGRVVSVIRPKDAMGQ